MPLASIVVPWSFLGLTAGTFDLLGCAVPALKNPSASFDLDEVEKQTPAVLDGSFGRPAKVPS